MVTYNHHIKDGMKKVMQFQLRGCNVFYRVTAHHQETDHPRVVFINSNDLS